MGVHIECRETRLSQEKWSRLRVFLFQLKLFTSSISSCTIQLEFISGSYFSHSAFVELAIRAVANGAAKNINEFKNSFFGCLDNSVVYVLNKSYSVHSFLFTFYV